MLIKLHAWSKGTYIGQDFRGRVYYQQTKAQKFIHKLFIMHYTRKHRKYMRMAIGK